MSTDGWICCGILAVTIGLFLSDRIRLDVVALLALLALTLTGLVTLDQALAGFANPIVVMIAGLFVVGAGLARTGVAEWLGQRMATMAGSDEVRLLVIIMVTTALLSGFMSSTGTVAVLLPVVVTIAQRRGVAPGRLLMPMAFASLLGGMLTLVGTPPNLIVNGQLRDAGHSALRFFSFTPSGLVMLVLGIGFMVLVGRRLLPGAAGRDAGDGAPPSIRLSDLAVDYGLGTALHTLHVPATSAIVNKTLAELALRNKYGLNIIGLTSAGEAARHVDPNLRVHAGDLLRVQGTDEHVKEASDDLLLSETDDRGVLELPDTESLAEIVLPRRSKLVGQTLDEARFRSRYRATVVALRRRDRAYGAADFSELRSLKLSAGDTLLLAGKIKHLHNLRDRTRDMVMVTEPRTSTGELLRPRHALLAIAITLCMLVLMTFGIVPHVVAVMLAGLAMVLTGCIKPSDAYREINWESVVLIAGVLPMAAALDNTGVIKLIVYTMVEHLGTVGPFAMMAALFVVTSLFSQVISNTATTALVAPIAYQLSVSMAVMPEPFLVTVAIAASTAFATPIASPVNTIVLAPGGYRFADFVRVGVPLQLLLFAATLIVVPLLFPL